jgi:oligopeptide/dipeptide ABC transporter ATP-binding protein
MANPLLNVRGLKTYFHTFAGVVKAVDGVDFSLGHGKILGVVGESGGGKTVVGFSILGLIDPPGRIEAGEIWFNGEDLLKKEEREWRKIRGKDIAMVFQDPMTSLNPLYTIQDQMEEVMKLHENLSAEERKNRCIDLLREVGISQPESRLKNYPHQFSGGMRQRVIIAIALASKPKLMIADEPTTALDVTIQAQILSLMKRLVKEHDTSLILITHDLAVVSEMGDGIIVLYCGRIVEKGSKDDIILHACHPYTRGLLASIPKLTTKQRRLRQIGGVIPDLRELPPGCAFAPRCDRSQDRCRVEAPSLMSNGQGHEVACHFPMETRGDG